MPTPDLNDRSLVRIVPRKLRDSLAERGLRSTIRRLWRAASSALRERRLGIRTSGSITASELEFDAASFGYQPVPYASFDAAMRHVSIRPDEDVFIDYGCGMGRAVCLAATYPFRRVIGVERSDSLSQIARDNIRRASSKLRCDDVTIATEDARKYEVPTDATHIFLFNPFDEPVLMTVLARIRDSLHASPRKLSIIYALPKCRRDPLVDVPWLTLQHKLETIDSDWQRLAVYESP
ncbi:MAG: class I SAM-dependent methyltransferase [Planctomycetota bacterium]|nr:class I SAM-dependent methyltransferase [Planctomycetota bacterium]